MDTYMPLIKNLSYRWSQYGLEYEELMSVGFEASVKALRSYDASKGAEPYWMKLTINGAMRDFAEKEWYQRKIFNSHKREIPDHTRFEEPVFFTNRIEQAFHELTPQQQDLIYKKYLSGENPRVKDLGTTTEQATAQRIQTALKLLRKSLTG